MLAAAQELFAEQGYDATSMRQIAQRAGVSVGTVASTGDKASLLTDVFGANDAVAFLGRVACWEARGVDATSFVDEMDDIFADWFHSVETRVDLVRDYLVHLLVEPTRREVWADQAMVGALGRRVLAHHPSTAQQAAEDLGYAVYATYAASLIGVVMGILDVDAARANAHRVTSRLVEHL